MHKLWKQILIFFMSVVITMSGQCVPAAADETTTEPEGLYALSACLMDADSGRVLFEKEGNVHRANASTTKILTLILTLERADLDETVCVSELAARQPDVQLNMKCGETYRLEDLCYSLMLESHMYDNFRHHPSSDNSNQLYVVATAVLNQHLCWI